MKDIKLSLRVFILQGVEAMRTHGNDMLNLIRFESLHIPFHQFLEEARFPHPADLITTTLLFITQNSKIDPCLLEAEDQCLGNLLNARIKGSRASSKIKIFCPIPLGEIFNLDFFGETFYPFCSFVLLFPPRVAMFVNTLHGFDDRLGDMAF